MKARILTVAGVACAAVALTAGAAGAAPTAAPTAPPVAKTTQTIQVAFGTTADPMSNTATVVFTAKKWSFEGLGDAGKFTNTGGSLVLKTTGRSPDKGCTYTGTYDSATTLYEGTFACPKQGPSGTFTVTTTGSTATT